MGTAYTPGLTVSGCATIDKTRRLPIKGRVLVAPGQMVEPEDIVARAELPGEVETVRLAEALGLEPPEVQAALRVHEGEAVSENQLLAEARFFFGLFRAEVRAPAAGVVDFYSPVTGHLGIRKPPVPIELRAYIRGTVTDVIADEGVIIRTRGALVQGIFGVGGERTGRLCHVAQRPDEDVEVAALPADCRGLVLTGGRLASFEVLAEAAQRGAVGMVVGGIKDETLARYVGRRLGVAVTGQENVPLTLILTEGFGAMAMAERTFALLQRLAGQECSISGATQIRAGVQRPEIIVPGDTAAAAGPALRTELAVGTPIRIIRFPYFGRLGTVSDLPAEPQIIETGARVRVLKALLDDGREVVVPRANVEIIA